MRPIGQRLAVLVALLGTLALVAAAGIGATAQDPESTSDEQLNLSAGVYEESCGMVDGEPAYGAGDLIAVSEDNLIGYPDMQPILRSEALIDATIDDLFQEDETYSFAVRDNREDADEEFIACGELGGVMVRDQVVVGLFASHSPDYVGVAIFTNPDEVNDSQDPAQMHVQSYLFDRALSELGIDVGTPVEATAPPSDDVPASDPIDTPVPTTAPVGSPTQEPTVEPTEEPTAEPTATATGEPTTEPTVTATEEPTAEPTQDATPLV